VEWANKLSPCRYYDDDDDDDNEDDDDIPIRTGLAEP
jgi:hypothetical protein